MLLTYYYPPDLNKKIFIASLHLNVVTMFKIVVTNLLTHGYGMIAFDFNHELSISRNLTRSKGVTMYDNHRVDNLMKFFLITHL